MSKREEKPIAIYGVEVAKVGMNRTVHVMRDGSHAKATIKAPIGDQPFTNPSPAAIETMMMNAFLGPKFRTDATRYSSADVNAVVGQIDVLREMSDPDCFRALDALRRASSMLADYRDRLTREEEAAKLSAAGAEAVRVDYARAEGFKAGVESVKAKAKK